MQYATVRSDGVTTAAVRDGDGPWQRLDASDLSEWLLRGSVAAEPTDALAAPQLLLPLPSPGKVICCGLNYGDHIVEMGRALPTHPTLFAKFGDTLTGPDAVLEVPPGTLVDWEAELAVVVGQELRSASEADAEDAIAGYTIANDISLRDWQNRTNEWLQGKAWDRTTPLGPVLVTPDEIDVNAGVDVICRVNGEVVQRGNTATLVFGPAALLAYISTFTTLRPGDIVLTGTPGGVGAGRTPPQFLRDGDVVETEVPGIGTLRNAIRFTSDVLTTT